MTNRTPTRSRRHLRYALALAVPASLFAFAEPASAQEWLKDRRYQEGAGVRAGDLELHPGIGGEVGYDSNWFLRSYHEGPQIVNGAPNAPPKEGAILRITPSLTLSTLGPQRLEQTDGTPTLPPSVAFRGGIAATYREFFGDQELRDQRNVSGNAFARLDINPQRPLGFGVFGNYQRVIQPYVLGDPNLAFNRSDVGAGGEVIAMPGGGTLDIRAGYQFSGALFEQSNGVPYTSLSHELSFRNRWKFRPRTALFQDTMLRWVHYPNADRSLNYLNDSTPLRTRIGVTGLVTDRFGTLLAIGYGATFFKNGTADSSTQYDSVTGQAEGTFYLSQGGVSGEPGQASLLLSTVSLGYVRDFQISLLGNYYSSNKGYGRMVYFFGGKTLLQLDGNVEALTYPQVFTVAGPGSTPTAVGPPGGFTNIRVGGTLFAEYRFTDAFGLNATFDYGQMISDTQLPLGAVPAGAPGSVYDLAWRRVQAFLGARWFL